VSSSSHALRDARVLVAGAGYVGLRLAERLASDGATVFALRRRPAQLPASLTPITANLLAPRELEALPSDLDFVVYSVSPDAHDAQAYRRAYLEGLTHLLQSRALARRDACRVLFTSSTAVYGQSDGSVVDEASETLPGSFSGKTLLDAENLLRQSGRPHVVLRLAGIYGPGRDRLVRQALAGEARYPAQASYTNRIHREDCAGALRHLMSLSEPDSLYLGVDHEPAELRAVQEFIAETTQTPAPRLGDASRRSRGGNKRCSSHKLRQSGYQFVFPTFREGYREVIASMLE